MSRPLRILALSGSFRADSVNTALLRNAIDLAPDGTEIIEYDYSDVPLYNGDLDTPDSVTALRQAITQADAVLLFSPEYNYSIPGVLKNAIDWASRPGFQSCLRDKPCGILSASPAQAGGVRGQQHTKVVLAAVAAQLFPAPEYALGSAYGRFEDGRLSAEADRTFLARYIGTFATWVRRVHVEPG